MDAYDSDVQLEHLKGWWNRYGNALILGITLGIAGLVGANYWFRHRALSSDAASSLYDVMLGQMLQKNMTAASGDGQLLISHYPSSPYAGNAALILARLSMEQGDISSAEARLRWAMKHGRGGGVRNAARLRLARLLMQQGKLDAALKLAGTADHAGFVSDYDELRGDIFAAQGKNNEARQAYAASLAALPAGSPYATVLRMKLDDLGPETGK